MMAICKLKSLISLTKHKFIPVHSIVESSRSRNFTSSNLESLLQNVGFIGLGNMGSRMAMNLIKSGYTVSVHDKNPEVVKPFLDKGVLVMETPFAIAEASDVVLTMLPSSSHVMDVYTGPNGLIQSSSFVRPWLFIDSSTIDPQTSRTLSVTVSSCTLKETLDHRRSPVMLDAPVSGGVLAAEAGTLTFMVGGEKEAYLEAEPLFLSMGKASVYCGGTGNGAAAKICNNLAMAISMIGVSEAFALGQSLGIASTTLTKIFNSSSARSWSSDTYNPVPGVMEGVPSSRNYQGGFSSKLMAKDLSLAAASAKETGANVPLTSHALDICLLTKNQLSQKFKPIDTINCARRATKQRIFPVCSAIILVARMNDVPNTHGCIKSKAIFIIIKVPVLF